MFQIFSQSTYNVQYQFLHVITMNTHFQLVNVQELSNKVNTTHCAEVLVHVANAHETLLQFQYISNHRQFQLLSFQSINH